PPLNFRETIKKIKKKGYSIILAHLDRYQYMDITDYKNFTMMVFYISNSICFLRQDIIAYRFRKMQNIFLITIFILSLERIYIT
ncbi:MAG: hypothetical protein LBC47_07795, partial [Tannerella sp.]|nr:hypothetical protein [Tannerella sp.]